MKPYPKYKDSGVEWIGEGQENYIFRIKKDIYWISANSNTIDELHKSIVGGFEHKS